MGCLNVLMAIPFCGVGKDFMTPQTEFRCKGTKKK
jgi:hypothetical protein